MNPTSTTRLSFARLLRVELTRLRWRRAVLLLIAVAVVLPIVLLVVLAVQTRPVSGAELAAVRADPSSAQDLRRCQRHPDYYSLNSPAGCEAVIANYSTPRSALNPEAELAGTVVAVVTIVSLLLLVAATTYPGQDWASGSMSNQLLFDPRRGRVWWAKATATTTVAGSVAVVVNLAVWGSLLALAHHRAIAIASGVGSDGVEQALRAAGLSAALALGAYALTMLFRSTVATLGVVFAVALVGGLLVVLLGGEDSGRWQPQNNVAAVVSNHVTYYTREDPCPPDGGTGPDEQFYGSSGDLELGPQGNPDGSCEVTHVLTAVGGTEYTGIILVLVVGASVLSFRRRDVP